MISESRYVSHEVHTRFHAVRWVVEAFGIPKGFSGYEEYSDYLNSFVEDSGMFEEYIFDKATGSLVAYFTWCVGTDIHRKGDILDVTQLIVDPSVAPKGLHRFLVERFEELAKVNHCDWVSRCKHEGSTLRIFYKEINHG